MRRDSLDSPKIIIKVFKQKEQGRSYSNQRFKLKIWAKKKKCSKIVLCVGNGCILALTCVTDPTPFFTTHKHTRIVTDKSTLSTRCVLAHSQMKLCCHLVKPVQRHYMPQIPATRIKYSHTTTPCGQRCQMECWREQWSRRHCLIFPRWPELGVWSTGRMSCSLLAEDYSSIFLESNKQSSEVVHWHTSTIQSYIITTA